MNQLFFERPLTPEEAYWHACTGTPVPEPEPRSRYWPDVNKWLATWEMDQRQGDIDAALEERGL